MLWHCIMSKHDFSKFWWIDFSASLCVVCPWFWKWIVKILKVVLLNVISEKEGVLQRTNLELVFIQGISCILDTAADLNPLQT